MTREWGLTEAPAMESTMDMKKREEKEKEKEKRRGLVKEGEEKNA